MQTPAAAKGVAGKRKSLGGKACSKKMIVKLLTEREINREKCWSGLEW
jgi:hypothetical protein